MFPPIHNPLFFGSLCVTASDKDMNCLDLTISYSAGAEVRDMLFCWLLQMFWGVFSDQKWSCWADLCHQPSHFWLDSALLHNWFQGIPVQPNRQCLQMCCHSQDWFCGVCCPGKVTHLLFTLCVSICVYQYIIHLSVWGSLKMSVFPALQVFGHFQPTVVPRQTDNQDLCHGLFFHLVHFYSFIHPKYIIIVITPPPSASAPIHPDRDL